jgi:hypothetical protein
MISPKLKTALAVYDEAAMVILANKGLYRRSQRDVEDGKVILQAVEDDCAIVEADGDTVRIDVRGPASASCTCPAPGICRHRLAAVLMIQALPAAEEGREGSEATVEDVSLSEEIAAFSTETLRKWTGKAAWRAALELAEIGVVVEETTALVVSFPDDRTEVRILAGQGLDGMVSRASPALRNTYHMGAMLAARRHFGIVEDEESGAQESGGVAAKRETIDPSFLAEIGASLVECTRVALNIAPLSLEERLFRLSVSSRAEALPRLAGMLRALSLQIRRRRLREFTFDADQFLELCVQLHALVSGLSRDDAPVEGPKRDRLRGRVRQDYTSTGDLLLAGCGADIWTAPSGARGATGYFYDPTTDNWLTVSLARAAGQDPWFDPINAYRTESIWGGRTIERLCRSEILLTHATASAEGRLSTGQNVQSSIAREAFDANAAGWSCSFDNWQALQNRLVTRLAMGPEDRSFEPVLLRPRRTARPAFDELAQSLSWPVEDSKGHWISLSLAHGRDRQVLMAAVEKIAASGWSGTIVALASIHGQVFRLRPIALCDGGDLYNLGLDDIAPLTGSNLAQTASRLMQTMSATLGLKPQAFVFAARPRTTAVIDAGWQTLVEIIEFGIDQSGGVAERAMEHHVRNLSELGFHRLSQMMAALASADRQTRPAAFLTASYAAFLARRMMLDLDRLTPA